MHHVRFTGQQLRAGTFIAGSAATGETVSRALALEVATAPAASSSAGLTYTFDLWTRTFARRAGTFGPAFSDRAVTIGRGKLSGGFSFLRRSYDKLDDLSLDGFDVFRFQAGTLPITSSRLELTARTETFAGFATLGVAEHVEVGVVVPYVRISVNGASRIFDQRDDELQRVFLDASSDGVGDIGIVTKWHFWSSREEIRTQSDREIGLAASAGVRLQTGDSEALVGLGLTRTTLSFIASANAGRLSTHVNAGYEFWSDGIDVPRDFLGQSTITAKDQGAVFGGLRVGGTPPAVGDVRRCSAATCGGPAASAINRSRLHRTSPMSPEPRRSSLYPMACTASSWYLAPSGTSSEGSWSRRTWLFSLGLRGLRSGIEPSSEPSGGSRTAIRYRH